MDLSRTNPKLKVLHIVSGDLWAGAEAQVFTLLTTLQKIAHVEVAAALMNEGELAQRLRNHHIPVTTFPETHLSGLQIFCGLRKLMREWKPNIVHTHRTKENVLGSLANRCAGNAVSVRTAHGANEHSARGFKHLHKQLFRQLDRWCGIYLQQRVIAVSLELAEKLALEFPRTSIVTVENGIDIAAVGAAVHPVIFRTEVPHAIHIGIVGRMVPVKRVDLFLEICAQLSVAEPQRPWHFHIFGDGPLHESMQQLAQARNIAQLTTFHGHTTDIAAHIAALDVLVMCSDHEGMPMTMLEALALRIPLIGHDTGGIHSVIAPIAPHWLVSQQSAALYAQRITELLVRDNTDTCAQLQSIINSRFSATRNATDVVLLYRQLLGDAHT